MYFFRMLIVMQLCHGKFIYLVRDFGLTTFYFHSLGYLKVKNDCKSNPEFVFRKGIRQIDVSKPRKVLMLLIDGIIIPCLQHRQILIKVMKFVGYPL